MIFTDSSRVWRSNTKGDYWVYDFPTGVLQQIGREFTSSSLMFAKFSDDTSKESPVTHAKNLQGNLLIIHGTADDNVHYQNMEYLVDELIRYNKQFRMMAYPHRSHGIYEGENTQRHLYNLITNYILEHNE